MLAGQEAAFAQEKGLVGATATGNLDAALLSRMLLCHYASLVSALNTDTLGSPGLHQDAAAQALQLHTVLR